jgi:hypothetical protein
MRAVSGILRAYAAAQMTGLRDTYSGVVLIALAAAAILRVLEHRLIRLTSPLKQFALPDQPNAALQATPSSPYGPVLMYRVLVTLSVAGVGLVIGRRLPK